MNYTKHDKYLFTTGEFAKLNNINKRTLHYYDEINLFSPNYKAANGYRYYTCFQIVQLEQILILRQIGLSISEIKKYTTNPSKDNFESLINEKKAIIDNSIKQLLLAKNFLELKSQRLSLGINAKHKVIKEITLPEEYLLVSNKISGKYDENDFIEAGRFSFRLKEELGLYDNFGSRLSVENIYKENYKDYDCFYIRTDASKHYDEIKPAGLYLTTFCIGGWNKLPEVYQELVSYANANNLLLTGYAYEEGVNEMTLNDFEEYITYISVHCTKKDE